MANIEVRFDEIDPYSAPIAHTATRYRLANNEVSGAQILIEGAGFTYDGDGIPTGGTITAIKLIVKNGAADVVLQRITGVDISLADLGDYMRDYLAVRDAVNFIDDDADLVSLTATKLRLHNTDGTFTDIVGTGFATVNSGEVVGQVTAFKHVAANGTTVLTNVALSVSFQIAVAAVNSGFGGNALYALLNTGSNVMTVLADDVVIGANTYHSGVVDGPGNDTINAGPSQLLNLEFASFGVIVNLNTGRASGGAGVNALTNVLNIAGSEHDDSVTGNSSANNFSGEEGDDILIGAGGADALFGGDGADFISGGDANDVMYGQDGADTLEGGKGADFLEGGLGADVLEGGAGQDTVNGQQGNDILYGGGGRDNLIGGAGADTFVMDSFGLGGVSLPDGITGYVVADDVIWLDHEAFNLPIGALAAARFRGNGGPVDASDRIIYEPGSGGLFWDPDGSGVIAQAQIAAMSPGLSMTSFEFLVI